MTGFFIISTTGRRILIFAAVVCLGTVFACRKRPPTNQANSNQTTVIAANPEQAKLQSQNLVEQGKELYKNDEIEKASEILKQAITSDPDNAEAHLRLGMAYAALDKKTEADDEYKKAIELFKKRIQADSRDGGAYFYLGEAYNFLNQDEDAARAYRQATRLTPDDQEAWYQLGMAETRLAQYPEAISAFQKALELDPNDYRATDALENAKEGAKRIREGKKHNETLLKKQQENANANGNANSNSSSKPTRTP